MGREMSGRLVLIGTQFHSVEHLGQGIAYARSQSLGTPSRLLGLIRKNLR